MILAKKKEEKICQISKKNLTRKNSKKSNLPR